MNTKAFLALEDGSIYHGYTFGAEVDAFGEVVFCTSMAGYQEMLTDPSYAGQILVPTYPLIGNYGVNDQDVESARIQVKGFVVREECAKPSHYLSRKNIHRYLTESDIPGIQGVDTRAITHRLRSAGVMMGIITSDKTATQALEELKNQGLSADELKVASEVLSSLLDVLEKTIETKTVDGGMALLLKPDALTFVAGGAIADGAKLETMLKQLAAEAQKKEPELAKLLTLDAETHQGVRFHTLAIPTEEMDEEIVTKLFGEHMDVVVGISETGAYLSVGRDAASTLKQVIDQSKAQPDKQIPPMRISLAAGPIAKFAAEMAEDDMAKQMAGMIGVMLEKSGGKDHLILTSKPIPNGAAVRLEVEEGLLKLIGSLGQMFGGLGGPGPLPPGLPGGAPTQEDSPF